MSRLHPWLQVDSKQTPLPFSPRRQPFVYRVEPIAGFVGTDISMGVLWVRGRTLGSTPFIEASASQYGYVSGAGIRTLVRLDLGDTVLVG